MIEFGFEKEKEILIKYATQFNDIDALKILDIGEPVNNQEVAVLAKLYWKIVDVSTEEGIEKWLERIFTSLHIYCGNKGYDEVWDKEIPQ